MSKQQPFRWYRIVGRSQDGRSLDFVYYVESSSPHNVIKYYGKRRKCETENGRITVQFPSHENAVQVMPSTWVPELAEPIDSSVTMVLKVIPATHYVCECGKEHASEFPYPSMWCRCGRKAYPVGKMPSQERFQQHQNHPLEYR
ncbi:hypothetical protein [Alicyclobacillus mengziensis]|uniref:Uncharacterized protein n=1 Tax=Alicyclobacillus mengziensis TaxID=2931921 RepID=A0A9X7VVS1_9BACL|nr:hypothetical protein [Alicyclobacillus mengziensis]QSO45494.1 hypothetical protein JZ786_13010 [Alicyclobacillus mengziensis]